MRARIDELNPELERRFGARLAVRMGVNTGEVVTGDSSAQATIVTGDAVNVAARLEQAAEPGEILLGESTLRLAEHAVTVEAVEPLELKGKSQPVAAYRLVSVEGEASPRTLRSDAQLVGREAELEALVALFERVVGERCCVSGAVIGEPGVGKSRLVAESCAAFAERARILEGRCLPYGKGVTFNPLAEMVQAAAGIRDEHSAGQAEARIRDLLAGEPQGAAVAAGLAAAIGLTEAASSLDEITWAVRRLVEVLAREWPLVLVVDDLHWAEPTLLDVLENLAAHASAPVLVLATARPELLDARPGWPVAVSLEPLGDEAVAALVEQLLRERPGAGDVKARVIRASGGNPLFAQELLALLEEDPALVETIPPSLGALLTARLDHLAAPERNAAECGSIEGEQFHGGGVLALTAADERDAVPGGLEGLERRSVTRRAVAEFVDETAYRFRHILIRDAAYAAIPKRRRSTLHEEFASWLEASAADRVSEYEAILGFHLEQAFGYRSELGPLDDRAREVGLAAASRLGSAGRRALARGDMAAAVNLLDQAAALAGNRDEDRAEILLDLGAALGETAELARADAVLDEAIQTAERAGRPQIADRARVELSYLRLHLDPSYSMDEAADVARRASSAFEASGDDLGLSRALQHLALVHWARCRLGEMQQVLERALVHAERAGDGRGVSEILDGLCRAALLGPDPVEEGIRRCEATLERAHADLRLEATAHQALAMLLSMQGRFDEARDLLRRAARAFEELGLTVRLATVATYAGFVELYADDPAAAEGWLREAYESLERMGERSRFSTVAALRADALCGQGRLDDAEACTVASETAASPDDVVSQALWRLARARILLARGQAGPAESMCRECLDFARRTDFVNLQGDALVALADSLRAEGRLDEARTCLERALTLYDGKGNSVSAATVSSRLDALADAGAP